MIRALSILTAIVALAVSAAPVASASTPEAAKGACSVPGFMDYTDDSCMAKPRRGSAPASAVAKSKPKPKPAGVYDHGLTQAFTSQTDPHADGLYVAKNRMSVGMSMGKPMYEW